MSSVLRNGGDLELKLVTAGRIFAREDDSRPADRDQHSFFHPHLADGRHRGCARSIGGNRRKVGFESQLDSSVAHVVGADIGVKTNIGVAVVDRYLRAGAEAPPLAALYGSGSGNSEAIGPLVENLALVAFLYDEVEAVKVRGLRRLSSIGSGGLLCCSRVGDSADEDHCQE